MQKKQVVRIILAVCFSVSFVAFITGCFRKRDHPVSLRAKRELQSKSSTGTISPLILPARRSFSEVGSVFPQGPVPQEKSIEGHERAPAPQSTKKTVSLTVWIHGTVGASFSLTSSSRYKTGDISDNSLVSRFMHQFRNQPILHYDQVLGREGFELFDPANYNQDTSALEASCYVIPAYQDIAHAAGLTSDIEEHAIFGWDGLLSQRARRAAAERLYTALIDYRDQTIKKYGTDPHITILAHSHGGNVALWLADCEQEQKKKLFINRLFMYGTPMQVETGHCIVSPFFKQIFLGYSRGDSIQRRDYFSTERYKSFMRMSDVADINKFVAEHPALVRADMGFVIGGDDKRVTHTNMWLLGRSVPVLACMDPLPLVVLTPLMLAAFDRVTSNSCSCTHYKVNLQAAKKRCWIGLASCQDTACRHQGVHKRRFEHEISQVEFRVCEKKVYKKLLHWSRRLVAEWRPVDPSHDVVFNLKNFKAIKGAVRGL